MSAWTETRLPLGEGEVACRSLGPPGAAFLFVNLHENESTAVTAAARLLPSCPARLVRFAAGGRRRLRFRHRGVALEVDPNRIFTTAGVEATLRRHNGEVPPGAVGAVEAFAAAFVELLAPERARVVVALHNTGDTYSVAAYLRGEPEAADAAAVHIEPGQHRHDFFFVTEVPLFDALRRRGLNVVLQHPRAVRDDGSLSVWCARHGITYVNVEARFGAVAAQREMLRRLWEVVARGAALTRRARGQ